MTLDPASPAAYLVGHLEEALTRHPRLGEQGLEVSVLEATGDEAVTVVVRGVVFSEDERRAVNEVVAAVLPSALVRNETTLLDYPEAGTAEQLG